MFNKCADGSVAYDDILDYFKKHVLTADDNVLNSIYYNFIVNNNVELLKIVCEQNVMIECYDLLFKNTNHIRFRPFIRMTTAMLMHDVLTRICNMENIIYDGNDDIDLRNLWNDVDINYYIYNDLLVDIDGIVKILLKRCVRDGSGGLDAGSYIDSIIMEIGASKTSLCEHVDREVMISIFETIASTLGNRISTVEDASTQADIRLEDMSPSRQRSLRSRRI